MSSPTAHSPRSAVLRLFSLAAGLALLAGLGLAACSGGEPAAAPATVQSSTAVVRATDRAQPSPPPAAMEEISPLPTGATHVSPLPVSPLPAPAPEPATAAGNAAPAPTVPLIASESPAQVLWRLGGAKDAEDARFSEVGGLAVGGDVLYVADAYGGVFMFDLAGETQGVISAGEIGYLTDVKVGPDGKVYVADAALHQITRFSADHDLLGGFGAYGAGDGEFGSNGPVALAVGAEGEVFALDPNVGSRGEPAMRVQVFSAEGNFLRGFPAEPGLASVGMTVSPEGTLLIVSRQGYVAEVEPEEGRLIQRIGQEALAGAWPQAIDVDDAGNLYVTTQIPTAVAVLGAQGHRLVERIGAEGVRTDEGWPAGEFLMPYGIAVTRDGSHVFVGETADPFAYVTAFERR